MDVFSLPTVGAACMIFGIVFGFAIGRVNALAEGCDAPQNRDLAAKG